MYPIPNFSGQAPAQTGGPGSEMIDVGQFNFDPGSFGGQNQFMNYPSMNQPGFPNMPGMYSGAPGMTTATNTGYPMPSPPGTVPPAGGFGYPTDPAGGFPSGRGLEGGPFGVGTTQPLKGNAYAAPTMDPGFTQAWDTYLRSVLGQGATPFDLSAILPSTGQTTAPGTLTAPENPILQSLQNFFQTGQGGPLPGVLPMWTSAMKAMDIPIQKQLANIKEQFGARGALGSSELASAMETYGAQTAADQEALLGQLTMEALPQMEQFGGALQQMDQGSIDRLVQEFIRTRPEYSPFLPMEQQMAMTFPPIYGKQGFGASFGQAFGQTLGSGAAGAAIGGLAGI